MPDPGIPIPPHAYVPGQTPRHPEDWFDPIKEGVAGVKPDQLHHSQAFQAGLIYLEQGYFWECHEVLEAVWMQTPENTSERAMVQALIQLANARLKLRMDRPRATRRLCEMVEKHLDEVPDQGQVLGLDPGQIRKQMMDLRETI